MFWNHLPCLQLMIAVELAQCSKADAQEIHQGLDPLFVSNSVKNSQEMLSNTFSKSNLNDQPLALALLQ